MGFDTIEINLVTYNKWYMTMNNTWQQVLPGNTDYLPVNITWQSICWWLGDKISRNTDGCKINDSLEIILSICRPIKNVPVKESKKKLLNFGYRPKIVNLCLEGGPRSKQVFFFKKSLVLQSVKMTQNIQSTASLTNQSSLELWYGEGVGGRVQIHSEHPNFFRS